MYPSKRNDTVDLIKTVAIFSVVAIHVSASYVATDVNTSLWILSCFFRSLASGGVPLFLMASGALLLRPEKYMPLEKLYGKNMPRILLALFFWAFVYCAAPLYGGIHSLGELRSVLGNLILFHHKEHLYYLHMMILVYGFLPLSRIIACHSTKNEMKYLLALWLVLGIFLPTVRAFYSLESVGAIPLQWIMVFSYSAIGYTFMGYFLSETKPSKNLYTIAAILGFAMVFGCTYYSSKTAGQLDERFFEGMSVGVFLWSVGIFALAQHIRLPEKGKAFVLKLSKSSFAIYLVHVLVLDYLKYYFPALETLNPLMGIPAITVAVTAISYILYKILSHIPVVRKWLI